MDRRQKKSRQAILDACISLAQEKDLQRITIREIVERADLNRGTFYLHFQDKYDMMSSFEDELVDKIEKVVVDNLPEQRFHELFLETRYDTLVQILQCYEENQEHLQLILKSSHNSSFQAKLREKLKNVLSKMVLPKLNGLNYDIPIDLFTIIFTSVSLSIAEYSYQSETPINKEELAAFLVNTLLQGPGKTLGLQPNKELDS